MSHVTDLLDRLRSALADRYAIERVVGTGGMATVYLADDLKHHRKVALKVLHPQLAAVIGPERFLREIEIAASLAHPHILPLYDSGRIAGSPDHPVDDDAERPDASPIARPGELLFYTMPYVDGESLRERLNREKQLPLEDALRISREVADALSYAHARGVVHRDIKPENILLQAGHAVVTDFGIARAIDRAGGETLTQTGMAVGTPAYMSPEQAAGGKDVDGRSDLYSLACVLYEMLAGEPPFTGPTVESLVHQHLAVEPRSITSLRPAVPAPVAAALQRALSKTPADRFNPVVAFAEALGQPGSTGSTSAMPSDTGTRRPAWMRRIAIGAAIAVAAVVVVLFGRRLLVSGSGAMASADRVVVLPYENRTGDPALDPVGPMVAEWITEGLMQTGAVQAVPNFMAAEAAAQSRDPGGTVDLARIAERTQSAIAVTGSYYRHGEQLEFHSEIVDVASGTSFARVDPVSGAAGDPRIAIDSVRIQVMGALATRLNRRIGWELPPGVQPPTYEASRAYTRGMDAWTRARYDSSAAWFERAYVLDTTYLRSLMLAVAATGNRPRRDSLLGVIEARRDELSPYDRYRMDYLAANLRGDHEGALAAARAGVQLVPFGTLRWAFIGALLSANRPREALASLEDIHRRFLELSGAWYFHWQAYTRVLHQLGEHERELNVARESRAYVDGPLFGMSYEATALAALGRIDSLMPLVEEIRFAAPTPILNPGEVLGSLVEELRAHGQPSAAAAIAREASAWYDEQPAAFQNTPRGRWLHGWLLELDGDLEGAAAVFAALAADSLQVVDALGYQGVIAARRGDGDAAARFAAQLEGLRIERLNGRNTVWRARIAAVLGEREGAVGLLRRAFAEGLGYGIWLHRDPALESLRGFRPYEDLVRPKG